MAISWIGCAPGNFRQGRPTGFRPEAVVIHIMDGPMSAADSHFDDPKAKVSAHYGIGRDGEIHQYVKETDTAFHAGIIVNPSWPLLKPGVNPNFYTIGIEHEGLGNVQYPWPDKQLGASVALVTDIAKRWSIALNANNIVMHRQIRANKSCPGIHFDKADYLQRLAGAAAAAPLAATQLATAANLKLLVDANLRRSPRTDAAIVKVLAAGETFTASQIVPDGEVVHDNPVWYGDGHGEFLWAGTTDNPQGAGLT